MRQIIIDCDPGHDDALAIMTAYANPEKLRILGVTTVGGNQTLQKVTRNAQNILQFIKAQIPLAAGQEGPLVKELKPAAEAHGDSGMDGPYFDGAQYPICSDNAVTFMRETIMNCRDNVTIVALAPLTNIALLLKTFPEVKEKIECISLMGGGISHGNCTELAEFNIYVDPEAARIVFLSGVPIIMSGLDVTEKAAVTVEEIQRFKDQGRASHLAYELLDFYHESGKQFGFIDSPIHDLCAVAVLLKPEIFQGSQRYVDVVTEEGPARGMTYTDQRKVSPHEANTFVLEEVDRQAFADMLREALKRLDQQ